MLRRIPDPVHGDILLTPLASRIVSTPLFSRLRSIHQLGCVYLVFPSATHTRFEHSLGVYHLARRLCLLLRKQSPCLVDESDLVCVEVAALLHDLGHGPFSHLFERYLWERQGEEWSHEAMTLRLIDVLLSSLPKHPLTSKDVAFVRLLVNGIDDGEAWPTDVGRGEDRRFLCDVIHDRRAGMDVDRLDYLARDSLFLFGATREVDLDRILAAARVEAGGRRVVYDARAETALQTVQNLRSHLHLKVYQNRRVLAMERRVFDLLDAAWEEGRLGWTDEKAFGSVTDASLLSTAPSPVLASLYDAERMIRLPAKLVLPVDNGKAVSGTSLTLLLSGKLQCIPSSRRVEVVLVDVRHSPVLPPLVSTRLLPLQPVPPCPPLFPSNRIRVSHAYVLLHQGEDEPDEAELAALAAALEAIVGEWC